MSKLRQLECKKKSLANHSSEVTDIKWDYVKKVECLPTSQYLRSMDTLEKLVAGTWWNHYVILVEATWNVNTNGNAGVPVMAQRKQI